MSIYRAYFSHGLVPRKGSRPGGATNIEILTMIALVIACNNEGINIEHLLDELHQYFIW